ncbi:DUF6675 family protein [Treponema sp. R6D11]
MKYTLMSIYMFSLAVCAFAVPLETLVTADQAVQLHNAENGQIVKAQLKNPVPALMPKHDSIRQNVTGLMNSLNPNILVEALYLYDKPAKSKTEPAVWNEKQKVIVFNQLTSISTLAGIKYYSASRGAMRVFYESSSVIDSPQTKKTLPDPVFTQPPAVLTIYTRQKDLTFGDNIYRYDYVNTADSVLFTQENITALNYGVIPVIGKGNLHSVMAVIDCGDKILIYAASMAKAASLPGLSDKISASFSNRAQAILHWFSEKINNNL